jgi:hypothetical protein
LKKLTFAKSSVIQSRDRPFEIAKVVTFVHPRATLQFPAPLVVSKCDLFADNRGLVASPYDLKSRVSLSDFWEFLSVLEGTAVELTTNNFKGLWQLCEEFRFRDLEHNFRNSALPKISRKTPKLKSQSQ